MGKHKYIVIEGFEKGEMIWKWMTDQPTKSVVPTSLSPTKPTSIIIPTFLGATTILALVFIILVDVLKPLL